MITFSGGGDPAITEMDEAGDEMYVVADDLETYVRVYRTPYGWVLSERAVEERSSDDHRREAQQRAR